MPEETQKPTSESALAWAASVWARLTARECAGVLWIALRYDVHTASPTTTNYINTMAQLAWVELGHALQVDIARTLASLRVHLVR